MIGKPPFPPEQAAALLAEVIATVPEFDYDQDGYQDGDLEWLGRAHALLRRVGSNGEHVAFEFARKSLFTLTHSRHELLAPLYQTLAAVELDLPASKQGAFIASGDKWNGYAGLIGVLSQPGKSVLIVDPYLDASFALEFLPVLKQLKQIRCLTSSREAGSLLAAAKRWVTDEPNTSLEIRQASRKALHDRLIIFGRDEVHLVSQSFKDIAARSPASIQKASPEVAEGKQEHYEELWREAETILKSPAQ